MSRIRTTFVALFIALPILSLVLGLLAWLRYGVDLPYMDDWRQYFRGEAGSFSPAVLFHPSNDTLYPVGIALDSAAVRWLGGNSIAYQAASMLAVLPALLMLQWLLLRHVFKDFALVACAFAFTLLMLQPGSYWGLQNMAFHQAVPLICILLALYVVVVSRMSMLWVGVSVFLLGIVSGMTYISGAFAYLACGATLLLQSWVQTPPARSRQRTAGLWMTLAGVITSIPQAWVIAFYQKGTHRADAPLAMPHEADFWFYLLGKVGRSLLLPAGHPVFSLTVSLLALALLAWVLWAAMQRGKREGSTATGGARRATAYADGFAILLPLAATVAAYLLLVAAGRANLRDPGMTDNLVIFSFGYLRFHFFWVTLLWPWVAGFAVAWLGYQLPRTRTWLPYFVAILLIAGVVRGAGFDHMNTQKLLAAKRTDGVNCIRREADAMRPIVCESIELRDLRPALEFAEQVGASFIWNARASAQVFTPANSAATTPMAILPGDFIDGQFIAAHTGKLTSVAVRVGNFQETSDGQLAISICNAARCSIGVADLSNTSDNNYLEVRVASPVTTQQNEPVRFRISSRQATRPVAVWLNPPLEGSASLWRFHSASGSDRAIPNQTLRLEARYQKQ